MQLLFVILLLHTFYHNIQSIIEEFNSLMIFIICRDFFNKNITDKEWTLYNTITITYNLFIITVQVSIVLVHILMNDNFYNNIHTLLIKFSYWLLRCVDDMILSRDCNHGTILYAVPGFQIKKSRGSQSLVLSSYDFVIYIIYKNRRFNFLIK